MRRPLIAGNWKMHGTLASTGQLAAEIIAGIAITGHQAIDIVIIPAFVHLANVHLQCKDSHLQLGAQNVSTEKQGAFTGEISATMLKDIGCQYVLVGHSERRLLFHDTLECVARKFQAAQSAGLIPILCVGETQTEREQQLTETVIAKQLNTVLALVGIEAFRQAVIAYEPVWAIGTGLTATPEHAEAVHVFIRTLICKNNIEVAQTIRILYGGSMRLENAAALLAMPNIDGGLIGGASLEAQSFLGICTLAAR